MLFTAGLMGATEITVSLYHVTESLSPYPKVTELSGKIHARFFEMNGLYKLIYQLPAYGRLNKKPSRIGVKYRNPRGGDIDIRLCKKMMKNDKYVEK